jgi:hypothetical protein
LQDIKFVYLIRSTEIDALYPVANYYDAHTNQMGHIPYTEEYFAALGAIIVRKIFAVTTKQFKVILSDCDDTLWRGTCGEVGAKVRIDTSVQGNEARLASRLTLSNRSVTNPFWIFWKHCQSRPGSKLANGENT